MPSSLNTYSKDRYFSFSLPAIRYTAGSNGCCSAMPLFCFITVPPEITASIMQINKWRRADGSEGKWMAGKRDVERKMGVKKKGRERERERGHGKGKIKEKVVKRCVLVLSWCLPAGLDTIPQLCLTHTHIVTHTEYLQSPPGWPPNEPNEETPHRPCTIRILARPLINIHTHT